VLSDWIVSDKEVHPQRVSGSIFRTLNLDPSSRIVARIIEYTYCNDKYWIGFICGKSSVTDRWSESYYDNSFEVKDEFMEVVAFKVDIKLAEMGYKINNIGKFDKELLC